MKLLFNFNMLILIFLQLHSLVYSQAPSSGCAAISDKGRCYNSFTSSAINWQDARDMCLALGEDLATVTSLEENTMLYNSKPETAYCWIGLNDIDVEGTFVWADGSESTYRNWNGAEPNNQGGEDCVEVKPDQFWNDKSCVHTHGCYLCSTAVRPFGEQISPNTYTPLKDNSLLNRNTTLYCITETKNTPQVIWSYTDPNGVSTTLSATTNATTGVSTLYVTSDKPGYYRCVVSQNGGNTRTYTTVMLDSIIGAPVLTLNYGSGYAFSLLPPAVNRADIPVLTQNVILSANLVGRWQTPNGTYVDSDSIRIPTLYVSHAGLYKFYVTNWDGVWTLAIQIDISPVGGSFGIQINTTTLITLPGDSILISDTTLYCITSSRNSTEVEWSYEDVFGNRTNLSGTTNASTGISTLSVTTDVPGYYSCRVSLEGGISKTYTVEMIDISQYTVAENTDNYQYTMGVDADNIFLFCHSPDNSVQLSDINWKRQDRIGFFPNPLDLHRLGYLLKYTNTHPMECFETESGNPIMSVQLYVQGPPIITLYLEHDTALSLLPPAVNRADIPVLTQNVILSANLVGRWQTPNGSYVDSDSIRIPTLYVSHAGLYKFYVTNWDGVWTLGIQIDISPVETYTQTIMYLTTETTSQTSMLVAWSLSETNPYDSEGTFSVYFGFGNFDIFVGTTKNLSLEITGLVPNGNYTVRVELQYPYSAYVISATTHHLLALSGITNPPHQTTSIQAILGNTSSQSTNPRTTTESPINTDTSISYTMYTIIAVLGIFVTFLILVLLICVFFVCAMKRGSRSKVNSRDGQIQLPQIHGEALNEQMDRTHTMAHNNKSFLYSDNVNVSEANENKLDLKVQVTDDSDGTTNLYANNN